MDSSPISSPSFSLSTPPISRLSSSSLSSRLPSSRSLLAMSGPCKFSTSTLRCPCEAGKYKVRLSEASASTSACMECGHDFRSHLDQTNENLIAKSIQAPCGPSNVVRSSIHPNPFESERPFIHPENIDPCICTRSNIIENLYKELKAQRVLHVRGTPTSGKSVLGVLLQNFIDRNFPEMETIFFTWPTNLTPDQSQKSYRGIIKLCENKEFPTDPRKMSNLVLVIDEAQRSYQHSSLWNDLIKYQAQGARGGAYIVLLSSYGSPSEYIHEYEDVTSTPPFLSNQQRISLRPLASNNQNVSLYFVRAEFNDVIKRATLADPGLSLIFSEDLVNELFRLTCGHAGCTRALLEVITHSNHSRESRKNCTEITVDMLHKIMGDSTFFGNLKNAKGFGRSFPRLGKLQKNPDWATIFQHVVAAGHVKRDIVDNDVLNFIYKKGWLHAELEKDSEDTVYIFPTNIHQMFYAKHLRLSNERFPTQTFSSLDVFWRTVVQKFSRSALATHCHSIGTGGLPRPMEAQYADEFYRSAWQLLGNKSFLTSEWSGSNNSTKPNGRIDFVVRNVKWGIELMRDGDHPSRHLDRFKPGGQYYNWITDNNLAEWVVLDFRRSKPQISYRKEIFHVVFIDDYWHYTIIDGFGQVCEGPTRLLAEAEAEAVAT